MKAIKSILFGLVTSILASPIFADTTITTTNTVPPQQTTVTAVQGITAVDRDALVSVVVSDVQAKISQDPTFTGTNIAVTSQPGVVIVLNGSVDSQTQVDAAISAARSVPGVVDVHSNLTVKGMAPTTSSRSGVGAATTTTTTTATVPSN